MKINLYKILLFCAIATLLIGCSGQTITISLPSISQAEPATAVPVISATSTQPANSVKLPKGVFVDLQDKLGLTYFNLQGQSITKLKTPGSTNLGSGEVVVAGGMPPGPIMVPIVYVAVDPQSALMMNVNDQITTLVTAQNIFRLAGAPGSSFLAYSQVNQKSDGMENKLFAGSPQTIAQSPAVINSFDTQGFLGIVPVAVDVENDTLKGVWFTKIPFGIGGDIVFDPYSGLYYYNQATGAVNEYLNAKQTFQGLSPDHTLAAYTDQGSQASQEIKVLNLKTGILTSVALDPGSDRGGGFVQFSADDRFMSWMEGSGFQMAETPNFHSRLRIAQMGATAGVVLDLTDVAAAKTLGYTTLARIKPVGWLDNKSVLLEVRQENWDQVALVKLDVASGSLSAFCNGSFVAFAYE